MLDGALKLSAFCLATSADVCNDIVQVFQPDPPSSIERRHGAAPGHGSTKGPRGRGCNDEPSGFCVGSGHVRTSDDVRPSICSRGLGGGNFPPWLGCTAWGPGGSPGTSPASPAYRSLAGSGFGGTGDGGDHCSPPACPAGLWLGSMPRQKWTGELHQSCRPSPAQKSSTKRLRKACS